MTSPPASSERRPGLGASCPPRRVLISGGTSGIGYACAQHLASQGDQVWVLGSSPDGVKAAQEEIGPAGASVCDVSVECDVLAAVEAARDAMGGIDGVFVNAGIDGPGLPAVELDADNFRRLLDVNVIGAFLVARTALRGSPPPVVDRVQRVGKRPETGAQLPRLQRQQGGRRKHGQVAGHGGERKRYCSDGALPGLLPDPYDEAVPRRRGHKG